MAQVNRRQLLIGMSSLPLGGCMAGGPISQAAGSVGGENAAFSGFNLTSKVIEQLSAYKGNISHHYYSTSRARPNSFEIQAMAAPLNISPFHYRRSNGHKIPEEVDLSWRDTPPAGAAAYTGRLHGPFKLRVRSLLPADVLQAASRNDRVALIAFIIGPDERPYLRWALAQYEGEFKSVYWRDRVILQHGGDDIPGLKL